MLVNHSDKDKAVEIHVYMCTREMHSANITQQFQETVNVGIYF